VSCPRRIPLQSNLRINETSKKHDPILSGWWLMEYYTFKQSPPQIQLVKGMTTEPSLSKYHRELTEIQALAGADQAWHIQSGAGYVYMDCFAFLSLICPCLFLCPSWTACWNSGHSMLLFRKSWPNRAMFGLIVFKLLYVLWPTCTPPENHNHLANSNKNSRHCTVKT